MFVRTVTYSGRGTRAAYVGAYVADEWTFDVISGGECEYFIGSALTGPRLYCASDRVALTPYYPSTDRVYCARHLTGAAIGRPARYYRPGHSALDRPVDGIAPWLYWTLGERDAVEMVRAWHEGRDPFLS